MLDEEDPKPHEQDDAKPGQKDGTDKEGERKDQKHGKKEDQGKGGGKDNQKDEPPKKPLPRWPFFLAGFIVLVFVGVVLYFIFAPHPDVWTDDAYVTVHYATISPRVAGQVTTVQVTDNQIVKSGQILVTLDPRDYETAVAMAQAAIDRDTAQIGDVSANQARQPSLITEQQANVASAQARLGFSQTDQRRYTNLAATGAGTTQQHQQADTTVQQDRASLQSAQAALDASRRQLEVLQAQKSSAEGTVKADQAQLAQAQLNLSYTRIVAPIDGMVGQLTVEPGNNVAPGASLMAIVPLDQVYIEANYREVDLRHVRSGQHATVHVDAYNIDLDGVVDSVPPASGVIFASLPPNNATGNFTKIVQRLPVKIIISPGQPLAKLLRVGFSVETTIHTGLEDVAGEQANSRRLVTAPQPVDAR